MKMIGQNSPATPVPRTARPSGVGSSRASERMGTSVPSAVVASATAEQPPLGVDTRLLEHDPDGEPDRERHAPADRPAPQHLRRHVVLDDLEPGEEEQEREPELREERDVHVHVRDAEHLRPDEDPEHDLDDDRRQDETDVPAREHGAEGRGEEDEHERTALGARELGGKRRREHRRARHDAARPDVGPPMP